MLPWQAYESRRLRIRRELRRLAAVELPYSTALYIGAKLASTSISEPSSPLYVLLLILVMLLGTLSFSLNMLAVIVSDEKHSTLLLAATSILVITGGSATAAATFTAPGLMAKIAALTATLTAIALLAYNSVKAIELLAERPEATQKPTVQRPW
jgi:hypothetical protein